MGDFVLVLLPRVLDLEGSLYMGDGDVRLPDSGCDLLLTSWQACVVVSR
jgi:hypothetical protein